MKTQVASFNLIMMHASTQKRSTYHATFFVLLKPPPIAIWPTIYKRFSFSFFMSFLMIIKQIPKPVFCVKYILNNYQKILFSLSFASACLPPYTWTRYYVSYSARYVLSTPLPKNINKSEDGREQRLSPKTKCTTYQQYDTRLFNVDVSLVTSQAPSKFTPSHVLTPDTRRFLFTFHCSINLLTSNLLEQPLVAFVVTAHKHCKAQLIHVHDHTSFILDLPYLTCPCSNTICIHFIVNEPPHTSCICLYSLHYNQLHHFQHLSFQKTQLFPYSPARHTVYL